MFILSFTGVIKIILIIIGTIVALRFIGQLMIAKRNLAEQNRLREEEARMEKQRRFVERNQGKTSISTQNRSAIDVDYEELN